MTTATNYRIPQLPKEAIESLEGEIRAANEQAFDGWTSILRGHQKLVEASIKFWFQGFPAQNSK